MSRLTSYFVAGGHTLGSSELNNPGRITCGRGSPTPTAPGRLPASSELARLCEAMAGRGVNLILCATTRGEDGTVAFIADDETSAETALAGAGLGYKRRPALTIRMENQPGAGAATFRKLAGAGVNADLLVPVRVSDDLFFAVICVDDLDKARRVLGVQIISEDDFVL